MKTSLFKPKQICRNLLPRPIGVVTLSLLVFATFAAAQSQGGEPIRVGVVGPVPTGSTAIAAALYDIVGEAMRQGSLLAEDDIAVSAGSTSIPIEVLLATAPSGEAARRAATRLVRLEGVTVLIGGVGEGQAEELARVASENDVLFFNVGSASAALRSLCSPSVFHVEPSAQMYLDGLVEWYTQQGKRNWFIVYEATDEGRLHYQLAMDAIEEHGGGSSTVVGSAQVATEQPVYQRELSDALDTDAEVILLLVNARDQIPFLAQQTTFGPDVPVAPFPHAVTQSRNFISASVRLSHSIRANRIAAWDTTLKEDGAEQLNTRYESRWGKPMEPQAWTAYAALQILHSAADTVGTNAIGPIIDYLESANAVFDVHKDSELSFRPWNHQLRQPLYIIVGDDSPWGVRVSDQIATATLIGSVPASGISDNGASLLDTLGVSEDNFECM